MSISTTVRKAGPYLGNNVDVAFPFAFKVFQTSDVVVTRSQGGVETVLALTTDYSVSLNSDQDNAPGGAITLVTALLSTQTMVITSNVAALQPVTVTNGGGFFPAVFNGVFDRLTILVQQLAEKVGRAFTVPITYTGSAVLPVTPSGVLQWAPDGLSLQAVTLPDLSLSLALPSQAGHNGHPLFSNGVSADWRAITITDVAGLTQALNYTTALVGQVPTLGQVNAAIQAGVAQAQAQAAQQSAFLCNAAVIL